MTRRDAPAGFVRAGLNGRRGAHDTRVGLWAARAERGEAIKGINQTEACMYRVYSAPKGVENVSPIDKQKLLYKEVGSMDEAISFASHMSRTGHAVVSIEGDDGSRLDAHEIANALRRLAS